MLEQTYVDIRVADFRQVGRERVSQADAVTDLVTVEADYRVEVRVRAIGINAKSAISTVQFGLNRPDILEAFEALTTHGLALSGNTDATHIPLLAETEWEERSQMTIIFFLEQQEDIDLGTIEKLDDLAGTLEGTLSSPIILTTGPIPTPVIVVPSFSNVTLLSGFEGADGSTTFTDESEDARIITPVGNTQIDTSQFKFGSSSALFDGSGDKLTVPDSDDFEFDQVITVEVFVRFNVLTGALQTIIGKRNSGTPRGWIIYKHFISSQNVLNAQGFNEGASAFSLVGTTVLVTNTQYHVALVRESSGLISMYLDGALEDSAIENSTSNTNTEALTMGFDDLVDRALECCGECDGRKATSRLHNRSNVCNDRCDDYELRIGCDNSLINRVSKLGSYLCLNDRDTLLGVWNLVGGHKFGEDAFLRLSLMVFP